MTYSFWNHFIDQWRTLPAFEYNNITPLPPNHNLLGWTNPNPLLLNSKIPDDYSLKYLPEPWWGYTGQDDELHAVIVNYNPGSGKPIQCVNHKNLLSLFGSIDYQEFVKHEVDNYVRYGSTRSIFPHTNNWHYEKRVLPIRNALNACGIITPTKPSHYVNDVFYKSCLSLELIPWHTQDISKINNYVDANLNSVKNVLHFAAEHSNKICNDKLEKHVLLKMSKKAFKRLLKKMHLDGIIEDYINISCSDIYENYPTINAKFSSFEIMDFPGVTFTCIWMPDSFSNRMGLPLQQDLDWFFQHVL